MSAAAAINRFLGASPMDQTPDHIPEVGKMVSAPERSALVSRWQPINTYPEGQHVLFWWPNGERGRGGIETATAFWRDGKIESFWTHGGPNSGSDWDPADGEQPTHWMPLPEPPEAP